MCYHKRTLYTPCGHASWGRQVLACPLQDSFLDGEAGLAQQPCDTMNAHPLHSVRVEMACPGCGKKQRRARATFEQIRNELKGARERLARHRKSDGGDGGRGGGHEKRQQEEEGGGGEREREKLAGGTGEEEGGGEEEEGFREVRWEEHAASDGVDDGEFDPIVLYRQ
ncbi:hypothetical protein LZ554_007886 [Drepanopeziza brunnea f. sp. 'monogermtubi']|nr:hypothetical protein LZ554_007886 [Drepanopeziza brunnea f. sp. 'monogermtubi']